MIKEGKSERKEPSEKEWAEIKRYVCKNKLWGLSAPYFYGSLIAFKNVVGAVKLELRGRNKRKIIIFYVLPYHTSVDKVVALVRNKFGNLSKVDKEIAIQLLP